MPPRVSAKRSVMKTVRDLSGKTFGRLIVVLQHAKTKTPNGTTVVLWLCKCVCGNFVIVRGSNLRSRTTKSCGCLRSEVEKVAAIKHGGCSSKTYQSWRAMRERCSNPNNSHYNSYGGRGIVVCERWNNFALFLADMGERPPGKTLDRINNNGNYNPTNCRWATDTEQRANKRSRKEIHEHSLCCIVAQ